MKIHRKCLNFGVTGLVLFAAVQLNACVKKSESTGPGIHILTYSSLGSKGGFLASVKAEFESTSQCKVSIETTLGATQVLSYLDEPNQRAKIDVVMGVDKLLFERAKSAFFLADGPDFHAAEKVLPVLRDQIPVGFIPLDYGSLSFIYRKADLKGKPLPVNLVDILKPEFKGKWIVQDPRASSPGMLFFLFADSMQLKMGDLRRQWATLAPSWDSSYKMFLAHESSMVWSYLTSLAYHASKGEFDQYAAIEFKEGLPLQLEGMAVLNRVGNPYSLNPCIGKWVQFLLTPAMQTKLVAKQYMMPVLPNVKLPEFFDRVPELKKVATLELSLDKVDHLISRFGREVQGDAL